MVDCSSRAKVLDLPRIAQGASPRAAFYPEAPAAQFLFRGGQAAAEAAGMAWGIGLPRQACRSAQHGGRTALWLGPDEWLLLSHGDSAEGLENAMAAALGDAPHSVVSVGHRNVALRLEGPDAALLLNAGCPLDLNDAAFPVGMCTRTILAKAQIILWRTGPTHFFLSTWRSFAPYVWDYLVEARARL